MNETLCRALLRAGLSGDDVAARLHVDPKTVRRWLDGRTPYLQHRWALALLVGMDESDLWPRLRSARPRPGEVLAIYPHRDQVPAETWVRLFASARREIGVLANGGLLSAVDPGVLEILAERARAGVRVRVSFTAAVQEPGSQCGADGSAESAIREALGSVEFRVHTGPSYNSICYSDQELVVVQHVYGIPCGAAPVLHLRGGADEEIASAYLNSFERIWADARPLPQSTRPDA